MEEPEATSLDPVEEPAPTFAMRVVDPINSVVWFAMDAFWMCELVWPAYGFATLTVITGIWLLFLGWWQKRGVLFADLGLNCWIAMNTVWLVADLNGRPTPLAFTVPLAVVGATFIAIAAWYGQDFRRLRIYGR